MPDDYSGSTSTTGRVTVGGSATGAIETWGDSDWFAVTLTAGQRYQFALNGSTLMDPYLTLYNSAGLRLAYDDDGGPGLNSLLLYSATASGTYYLGASGYGSATGAYTLTAAIADDYGSTAGTAGRVYVGGSSHGQIDFGGDTDWFAVYLNAGQRYQITLNGVTLADPLLTLYDVSGVSVASNDNNGTSANSLVAFTPTASGTYYIGAAAAAAGGTGTYTVGVATEDDYAGNTSTTGTVSVGGSASGRVDATGDSDWFAVTLTAGQRYQFSLNGVSLSDPFLTLYSSSGMRLAYDDDGGGNLNSLLTYSPSASGTYYLGASGYGSATGSYTLRVAQSADDYAGNSSTTGQVSAGGTATGTIETMGDTDWFAITLTAGQRYQFALDGVSLADPYLSLYNASGMRLAYDDDSGTGLNSLLNYAPTTSGTYYLSASGYGSKTGSYTLRASVSSAPTDDYAGNSSTTGRVQAGASVQGAVEVSGDTDWFAIDLTAGTRYQFALDGVSLTDPYLSLYSASGTKITSDDDSGAGLNSLISYTAQSSGTYYLAARGYATATGTYRLSATASTTAADDYGANTSTTGRLSAGGSATGRIETAGDHDWFAVTLTAGTSYDFAVNGPGLTDPYLTLRSGTGTMLAYDDDSGPGLNSLLRFTPTASGTFYLDVSGFGTSTGGYTVSASTAAVTAPAPSPTTGPAPTPAPTTGTTTPSNSAFSIEIVYTGDAAYRSYFDNAAARWAQVITADLPDVNNSSEGVIDDLRIYASAESIDGSGGVLGRAGPTAFRYGGGLPYLGVMEFDSADLASMAADGTLTEVILHEMGHVLGLGTMWQGRGLVSGSGYTGSNAVAQYDQISRTQATSVPLETGGGSGTRGSHWSEAVFNTELMTGYAESSPGMPLSVVTIGALADLGYSVNYAAANAFTL